MLNSEFLVTSLIVVLIPGTGVIYTVSAGLFGGRRAAVAAAFGCTAGILPHVLAAVSGLSLLLHTSAVAFQTVKIAGALYLLYMAWCMWRETGTVQFDDAHAGCGLGRIVVRGVLINILNPKLSIFFLSFLPLFLDAEGTSPLLQLSCLSGVFMGLTLIIFIGYGLCAHSVRASVAASPVIRRRLQRLFAFVFVALGARLAVIER